MIHHSPCMGAGCRVTRLQPRQGNNNCTCVRRYTCIHTCIYTCECALQEVSTHGVKMVYKTLQWISLTMARLSKKLKFMFSNEVF